MARTIAGGSPVIPAGARGRRRGPPSARANAAATATRGSGRSRPSRRSRAGEPGHEAQGDDLLLPGPEDLEAAADLDALLGAVVARVDLAELRDGLVVVADGLLERDRRVGLRALERLEHLLDRGLRRLGQLLDRRRAAELGGEPVGL